MIHMSNWFHGGWPRNCGFIYETQLYLVLEKLGQNKRKSCNLVSHGVDGSSWNFKQNLEETIRAYSR